MKTPNKACQATRLRPPVSAPAPHRSRVPAHQRSRKKFHPSPHPILIRRIPELSGLDRRCSSTSAGFDQLPIHLHRPQVHRAFHRRADSRPASIPPLADDWRSWPLASLRQSVHFLPIAHFRGVHRVQFGVALRLALASIRASFVGQMDRRISPRPKTENKASQSVPQRCA